MLLTEKLKKLFIKQPQDYLKTPDKPLGHIRKDMTADEFNFNYQAFFDGNSTYNYQSQIDQAAQQAAKIDVYRKIARNSAVMSALSEIIDEITYTDDAPEPLKVKVDIESPEIINAVQKAFKKIMKLFNPQKNLYFFVRDAYIDGQMNVYLDYDKTGIKGISFLDPRYLVFDIESETYKYWDGYYTGWFGNQSIGANNAVAKQIWQMRFPRVANKITKDDGIHDKDYLEYNIEEIVHQDFGLYSQEGLILSYLEDAIKDANVLQVLEDLLVPLRFSRSVSRRIFNVDVSDMSKSSAEAYMQKIMNTFKYKKKYNAETGEVTDNQHITSMVEDYWFGNMSGEKGVSVDVLDETGNLGELRDLMYMLNKLYRSMKVPTSYIQNQTENGGDNGSAAVDGKDEINREELRFFMRIQRLRTVYTEFFMHILKRELVCSNTISEADFNLIKPNITIYWDGENQFFEKLKLSVFLRRIDSFSQAKDFAGQVLPVEMLYKEIFNYSDTEIKELLTQLNKEKDNPLYKNFYPDPNEVDPYSSF